MLMEIEKALLHRSLVQQDTEHFLTLDSSVLPALSHLALVCSHSALDTHAFCSDFLPSSSSTEVFKQKSETTPGILLQFTFFSFGLFRIVQRCKIHRLGYTRSTAANELQLKMVTLH